MASLPTAWGLDLNVLYGPLQYKPFYNSMIVEPNLFEILFLTLI